MNSTNYPKPVYPKSNPEWEKKRKEIFYEQIKRNNWTIFLEDDSWKKPRSRKSKFKEHLPAKPRQGEKSWFDK